MRGSSSAWRTFNNPRCALGTLEAMCPIYLFMSNPRRSRSTIARTIPWRIFRNLPLLWQQSREPHPAAGGGGRRRFLDDQACLWWCGGDLSAPEWDCLGADIQPCIGCGAQVCNVRTVETDYSWMIYWENVGSVCLAGHCPFSMGRLSIIWDNCLRLGRAPVCVLTTSPEVAERSAWN